jgi:glycerophosphoryl diester phosphodiesterase
VGAKIPLLSEVLAWVRQHKMLAFLEIKGGENTYPGIEAKVLDEIDRAGIRWLATVVSFDLTTLRHLRELDSSLSLGLDVSRSLLALRQIKSVAGKAILPHWAIASRRLIRRAHEQALRVFPWTVDRPAGMERMIADGVDGIVTNYPSRLAEVLNRVHPFQRQDPEGKSQRSGDSAFHERIKEEIR